MIICHSADGTSVIFNPEDIKERKALDKFPGLLKQGLVHYCPNKQNVLYNLYTRLKRKFKSIRLTPKIHEMIHGEFKLKELPASFKFHTEPLKHQLIALRFAYTFGSFLNLSEPGLGKTKVTLDYIWLMQFKKTLIICPKPLRFVWQDERRKHRPELSVYVVETTDWTKEAAGIMNHDIIVVNYNKAVTLENELVKVGFNFIAVDEALIKDPTTDRTKSITKLGLGIEYKCGMSGTLVNNSPLDVFAPVRFIEPSLTGQAFGKFRDEYALVSARNRFITIGYRNVQEVKDMVASCSIIMTKAEWLKDLPPKEFKRIYVQMADRQRDYYHQLANNYLLNIEEVGQEVEVDNPLSVLVKLNQISNGFIYYKENIQESVDELYGEETKRKVKADRKTHYFQEQPKAQALIDLIASDEFNTYGSPSTGTVGGDSSGCPAGTESTESSCSSGRIRGSGGGSESLDTTCQTTSRDSKGRLSTAPSELRRGCGDSQTWTAGYGSGSVVCTGGKSEHHNHDKANSCQYRSGLESICRSPEHSQDSSRNERSCGATDSGPGRQSISGDDKNTRRHMETSATDSTSGSEVRSIPAGAEVRNYDTSTLNREGSERTRLCVSECNTEFGEERGISSTGVSGGVIRQSIYSGTRAIIWFNLAAELTIISDALNRSGHTFITIKGGDKDIGGKIHEFNTNPQIRFCVCQAKTINYGVTIMGTAEEDLDEDIYCEFDPIISDEIFYSINFSLEVFLQQQDRIHRIGQKRKCRYWLLLTNSKIERSIADRLEEKLICNKEILVDIISSLDREALLS